MSVLPITGAVSFVDMGPPAQRTCEVGTTCQPPSAWSKDPWPATIRAIGTVGLSLALGRRFERGSGLAIELPTQAGLACTVLARVVQVQAHEAGSWLLACAFVSELSDEEVERVLRLDPHYQPAAKSPGLDAGLPEQEEPPATAGTSIQGVLFHAKVRPGEYLRWYVNRLDLAAEWPLPRGGSIVLRVGRADAEPLELRVKSCRLFGSYWFVQCKLLAIPSDEALRALACPFVV